MRIVSTRQEEFFVAVGSNLGVVVGAEEGAIESISGNEGRIAQAWVRRTAFLLSLFLAFRVVKKADHKAPMTDRV